MRVSRPDIYFCWHLRVCLIRSHYIAPVRIQQRTPAPTALLLLGAYLLPRSRELVTVETCLRSNCLATAVSSGSAIPDFLRHVTIFCFAESMVLSPSVSLYPQHADKRRRCFTKQRSDLRHFLHSHEIHFTPLMQSSSILLSLQQNNAVLTNRERELAAVNRSDQYCKKLLRGKMTALLKHEHDTSYQQQTVLNWRATPQTCALRTVGCTRLSTSSGNINRMKSSIYSRKQNEEVIVMTTEPLKYTMAGTSLINRPHGHYFPKTPRSCNKMEIINERKNDY
jgi:hypothetical protein